MSPWFMIADARNWLFEKNILSSYKSRLPVVSLGNLTFGGTGKTPLTHFVGKSLQERGWNIAVLSRGYGGRYTGLQKVNAQDPLAASIYGDEPSWLAQSMPVFVGSNRAQVAQEISRQPGYQLLLLDDGFQHRYLKRDLDIVVIDATESPRHYLAPPWGRARERWSSLQRAQFVFLNKVNLASTGQVAHLRSLLHPYFKDECVFEFEYKLRGVTALHGGEVFPGSNLPFRKVVLASGIARPATFADLIAKEWGIEVQDHRIFADHHTYSHKDVQSLQASLGAADALVVTQKDAVKLRQFDWGKTSVWVTLLEPCPMGHMDIFYDKIDRLR